MKMTDRHRGTSPIRDRHDDDMYDDDYSEDFDDDDDADTSNRRYKTRSPLNRTDYDDYQGTGRPDAMLGANTYRKARGGMSLASGYFTPTRKSGVSRHTLDTIDPRESKNSLKTEYIESKKASMYTPSVYDSPRAPSHDPRKKVFYRSNRGGRGRGGGRGRFSQLGRSSREPQVDNIARRVLSARRLKINEMQNHNQELQQQLRELKDENKLLKKTQHRTDKALQRFEDRESDLPQLIQRQNNEVRSYKDQIRKWREKYEKTDRYLRDAEDELEKSKLKLKKLKSLADEKDLPERSDLNKKLNNAELEMEARDVKIKELERYIQNLEKNHKHEMGIERARYKDVNKQLSQLRDDNDKLNSTVREKDKELQMKNIYVQERRAQKPPHRLPNSYNGTPQGTPPPRGRRPSLSEADNPTPRERAKMMEDRRREELRRQRDLKLQHEKVKREQELRKAKEDEERQDTERWERQERDRQDIAEKERRMNEQAEREAEERRDREQRDRMKREAQEREQREREKREREERDRRREKEERERRERERLEQERRAAEERRRFEDDVSIQAERKKKDDILQKLREIDEGGVSKKKEKGGDDIFFVTQTQKEDSQDSMASKKSYTFSKPTENLHKGKPSHKDGPTSNTNFQGKRNRDVNDIESGGYNPSFSSNRGANSKTATKTFSLFDDNDSKSKSPTQPKPVQKSQLMDDLFGSSSKDGPKHNDIFANPKPAAKKTNPGRSSGFPWDDGSSNKGQSGSLFKAKRENSATLFGGGSALINDEELHTSQVRTNATLPRRPKQTTTAFSSRPTVNAVDQFDDDIEEVIL